ncbi:MAG: hypothetical protein U5R49_03480 [Deltaproteobacteria bacterium]|nr:hypothetical protein [Deltaproteobacteria bacterium]
MKAVTIRGVAPEVADKLKSTAEEQGKSINQLMLEILKQGLGLQKEKKGLYPLYPQMISGSQQLPFSRGIGSIQWTGILLL